MGKTRGKTHRRVDQRFGASAHVAPEPGHSAARPVFAALGGVQSDAAPEPRTSASQWAFSDAVGLGLECSRDILLGLMS